MNEQRIRELAEQASTHAEETVHYYMGQFDGLMWEAEILKERDLKFAELIVKECVELVSATRDLAIEDGWKVDEAMSTAINDIEEHFGVEL
jgi:hypothetical protein